jgi:hypothetical protein
MDGTRWHHVKQNEPDGQRQVSHFCSYAEPRPIKIKDGMIVKGRLFAGVGKSEEGEG